MNDDMNGIQLLDPRMLIQRIGYIKLLSDRSNNIVSQDIRQIETAIRFLQEYSKTGNELPWTELKHHLLKFSPLGPSLMSLGTQLAGFSSEDQDHVFKAFADRLETYGFPPYPGDDSDDEFDNEVVIPHDLTKTEVDTQLMNLSWERELLLIVEDCISGSTDPDTWKDTYYKTVQPHFKCTYNDSNINLKSRAIIYAFDFMNIQPCYRAVELWMRDCI